MKIVRFAYTDTPSIALADRVSIGSVLGSCLLAAAHRKAAMPIASLAACARRVLTCREA
jgi:hypothetical protein